MLRVLLLACVAIAPPAAAAEPLRGLVVSITDGDTLTLLDAAKTQHKVRLSGIDAPEKKQPFGQVARQRLAEVVFERRVTADCGKADRYGREVCKILLACEDVNLGQIQAGLAWHYKKYQGEQPAADRATYARAEEESRAARRGLWRDPDPVPPWEWRHPDKPRE